MTDRPSSRGTETQRRTRRDLERLQRRARNGHFWRALALIGGVGWPIVLLSTGGALVGRLVDRHWATGVRFTLMLLVLGTGLGTFIAFRTMKGGHP